MKNEILLEKYNNLSYLFDEKEKENFQLLDKINNKREILNLERNETKVNNEKNELLSYCNNTLSILIKWIETNLISMYNNSNNDYNTYNDYINIEKNDLLIFDKLKESLLKAKKIIYNKYTKLNIGLEEERVNFMNVQKESFQCNNLLENIYNHLYQEITNEKYFNLNYNDSIDNRYENDNYYYFNEIDNMINQTFHLLKKIKESSYDKSLDKLIEDNTQLSKENEIIKSKSIVLYNDNKQIFNYKNQLEKLNEELKMQLSNIISDKIK